MSNANAGPRDIRIPEDKRPKFRELTDSNDSPFNDWTQTDLFVFAASYGYDQGLRTELEDSSHALFQRKSLSDAQSWILRSIAVKEEEDPNILDDGTEVILIAREYANGGIDKLYNMYTGPKDLFTNLTTDVIELADIPAGEAKSGTS